MALRQVRRIAVYGVCQDEVGRVLLVARQGPLGGPDIWNLPGGSVEHGEDPSIAVVRTFGTETGLAVRVEGVREVSVELRELPNLILHSDRIVYDVRLIRGRLGAGSHRSAWLSAQDMRTLVLTGRARAVLGVPGPPEPVIPGWTVTEPHPNRGQRFSVYGVATDPDGRLLLTLIADKYPGAGTWHLPGGGTEFGEEPTAGLLREIAEETGQQGRITDLISVTNLHNPAAWGPEGRPLDWHGIRVTYRVLVDAPTTPVVAEVSGSTAAAGWFTLIEVAGLRLNRPAVDALARVGLLLPRH